MAYAGSTAAAAAAAAAAARAREEEQMTQYNSTDLNEDWEFKILRSATSAFRTPANLQKAIEEEARAGWVMVEKFDDTRVRFKRRRLARTNDTSLPAGYDPYRTRFGTSDAVVALLVIGTIAVSFIFVGLALAFLRGG